MSDLAPQYDNLSDILLGGEQVAVERQMIIKPKFDLPPAYASQFGDVIAGSEAKYIAPEGDRPSGYLVREVKRPANVDSRPSIALADGSPFVVTRMNATWLQPNEVFVVSGVPLDLLASGGQWRDYASTSELVHELRNPSTELGPDVSVATHKRVVQPLLDVTLLLIGLPLVVARGASSPYLAVGLSIAVVAGFFLCSLGGESLGSGGWISPALAAWVPLFIFAPLAAGQIGSINR